jgi:Undecaprenyl-phosphate galactose phosphotransferase WbaP
VQLVGNARYQPWWAVLAILSSDICGLTLSFGVSILAWSAVRSQVASSSYPEYLIAVALFVAICRGGDLYRAAGLAPVEELRRMAIAIGGTFLLLIFVTFLMKDSAKYSRGMIILAWCCAIILIPASRLTIRPILGRQAWFAKPVAILGAGRTASMLIETLKSNPELALRPVVAFDDNPSKSGTLGGVPVIYGLGSASSCCRSVGIDYAIVAMPGLSRGQLLDVIRGAAAGFSRLLLVPDLFGVSSLWVEARDVGGMLGLEIRDNLLHRSSLVAKRVLDLALIFIALPLVLPLCGAITLLVKLTSRGPAFYSQGRVGRGGEMIQVWKFRTMLSNAEELLQQLLVRNPQLQTEWLKDHKLKDDPRITAVGRFLRKTSLDELPQLWNVVKGEMSLVGPRPIVSAEIEKFGESYDTYTRVPPGITGPWQVSGRNSLSYEERVRLNEHYVRNWSVWLDLFILFKTIRVVLTSDGAY